MRALSVSRSESVPAKDNPRAGLRGEGAVDAIQVVDVALWKPQAPAMQVRQDVALGQECGGPVKSGAVWGDALRQRDVVLRAKRSIDKMSRSKGEVINKAEVSRRTIRLLLRQPR